MRLIPIDPGHRETFWHRNCVGVGLSAGFIEPLEASALVLVELSAHMLADQLPANRDVMDIIADKFNQSFTHRWQQIIGFLKLHYVLSHRCDSTYWIDHRRPESIPDDLRDQLELWSVRSPWFRDEYRVDEMFPSASYQYVLYGMGFTGSSSIRRRRASDAETQRARELFAINHDSVTKYVAHLPSNRGLLEQIRAAATAKM